MRDMEKKTTKEDGILNKDSADVFWEPRSQSSRSWETSLDLGLEEIYKIVIIQVVFQASRIE